MDAMDVAGENHIDIDHGMWKQRLGPDGSPVGEAFSEVVSFCRDRFSTSAFTTETPEQSVKASY